LERGHFISNLFNEIIRFPLEDSFVYGLYGSWGTGKTSFINLLIEKFKSNDRFIIINFNPWYFKDEKAILTAFYNEIEKGIGKKFIFPKLNQLLKIYQNLISTGISKLGISLSQNVKENSIETINKVKQNIESFIKKLNKKLFIIIDDMDRLQPEEIYVVLKLVRLNAKLKNTIFLLSFDHLVVQELLQNKFKIQPQFLEKIVQKQIHLPVVEQDIIDNFFEIQRDVVLKIIGINEDKKSQFVEDFHKIYITSIKKFFKTLRDVKRYFNGLITTLLPIYTEVNLFDFFILEIIRIFFPKIYKDIWENPWYYIPYKWNVKDFLLSPFNFMENDDKRYKSIQEHIDNIIEENYQKDKEFLLRLLKTIFFEEVKNAFENYRQHFSPEDYREKQRITHPECFEKYFLGRVQIESLSDEFVINTIKKWNSVVKTNNVEIILNQIEEFSNKEKTSELFNKLLIFKDRLEPELINEIINLIYLKFYKAEHDNEDNLFSFLMSIINDKIQKTEIQSKIENIINKTPFFFLAVRIVYSCEIKSGEIYNIYENTDIKELQKIVSDRLKIYFVDEERDIFEEIEYRRDFILHQWASNWMSFEGDNKKIVNDYIISIIKKNPKKFAELLSYYHVKHVREETDKIVFDLKTIKRIYDIESLKDLAEEFKNDQSLNNEEKSLIKSFLKSFKNNISK
jgi:predicted KAP-like P-loop ATPase